MDLDQIKRVGIAAARNASAALHSRLGKIGSIKKKGVIDLVTEADTAAEKIIIETIRDVFPDHAILAEESGEQTGGEGARWVIDPLDGTTNFVHRIGMFAVSIAFFLDGEPQTAVISNPVSGELFTASTGRGAECNGRPIHVSAASSMEDSLLATGFPYNVREIMPELMDRFTRCLNVSRGVRRLGSAALDLCYVADGRFDAFWEQNLKPWDTAAGWLMVREAGGRVTDFSGAPYDPDRGQILASNGRIHEEMITLLKLEGKSQ